MKPTEIYEDEDGREVPVYVFEKLPVPAEERCARCKARIPYDFLDFDPETEEWYCSSCTEQLMFDSMSPAEREEMGW